MTKELSITLSPVTNGYILSTSYVDDAGDIVESKSVLTSDSAAETAINTFVEDVFDLPDPPPRTERIVAANVTPEPT